MSCITSPGSNIMIMAFMLSLALAAAVSALSHHQGLGHRQAVVSGLGSRQGLSNRQGGGTYTNPVLWEDLADNDVFRVNDTYYYTASTMHYSPGAPILRSYDLVNWEYIGHAVPTLPWGEKYNLAAGHAYVKGIWASSMRYRPSNGLWYWIGCVEFGATHVYTARAPEGPWKASGTINQCLYDCGLLIDDDDTMWVAYGQTKISVARLAPDGLSLVDTKQVYAGGVGGVEGSRMYKVNGKYYIAVTLPPSSQYVLQATSPQGNYNIKNLVDRIKPPVAGAGNPHQGSLVSTPSGSWHYLAFIDAYPGGRMPVLAPMTWGSDGFPSLTSVGGAWGSSYPYPAAQHAVASTTGTDSFGGTALGPAWEWNHNPDPTKFAVSDGLTLQPVTVTTDLYKARNTLTKRIHGPNGVGTVSIDVTNMGDGGRTGLALLRDTSAWIGVTRSGDQYTLNVFTGLSMNTDWSTKSTGSSVYSTALSAKKIWLRVSASISPGASHTATFSYSTDGNTFTPVGGNFAMITAWEFFMGYRYGIFHYATTALGGSVHVSSFTST